MSLQNRIKNAQAGNFIGREEQLGIFRKNITVEIPTYPFILISGQGGVGKSALLEQLQTLCNENDIPYALTDSENTPSSAMNQFSMALEKGGYDLDSFRERYQKYLQLKEVIQKEPDKPDALGQILSRLAGKSVVVAGRATPITSVALDMIGSDLVEEQVTAFTSWLFQKLKHKDDVHLMLDPNSELTPLFIADLNKLSKQRQVVLFFDTFEDASTELLPWLMLLFDGQYGEVSDHISFVFAGRSFNQQDWLPVSSLLARCELEPFTPQETKAYLKKQGIDNPVEVDNIHLLSEGLPVYVAMLATNSETLDIKTARTVVEGFLRNISDPIYRQAILHIALCRRFDRDVLSHLLTNKIDDHQIDKLFSWLIKLPFAKFVQDRLGYWTFHPIVRAQIIAYQRSQSLSQFVETQQQLAEFYYARSEQHGRFAENKWRDYTWWSYYVEATYHAICANPRENLAKTKQEIADVILEVDRATIISWISALRQAATDLGEYEAALQLAALVEAGISAIETNKWFEAFRLFDTFGLLSSDPRNLDFEEGMNVQQIPTGWIVNGNKFQFGVDANTIFSGNYSGYLKSSSADLNESGRMMQFMKAEKYLGQRVRFSGYVKSKEVEEWTGLWMMVDGRTALTLSYDYMEDRPITGTTDWKKYEIVLDVPKESSRITFGVRLIGKGQIWIDNMRFEIVDEGTPTTTASKQEPHNLDFSKETIGSEHFPIYWARTGSHPQDYAIGVDKSLIYQGKETVYLKSKATYSEGFGSLVQSFKADHYIGKRLRMSAYVKSQEVEEWAGLWMRVDGTAHDRPLSFDNMQSRPITGTVDWRLCHIVLDVPEGAVRVLIGILIVGKGQVWVSDFQLEVVGQDVPPTYYGFSEPINLDFEQGISRKYPMGWFLAGSRPQDYTTGIDIEVVFSGAASAVLKSRADKISGFGTLMQNFSAEKYRNQRLLMSAYVKSKDVMEWAGLWMRVDGLGGSQSLSFDNMGDRPIKATTDWQKYVIVLDVPKGSTNIAFGILLEGIGQVWVDEFKFEVVSLSVPITGSSEQAILNCTEAIKLNAEDAVAYYRRADAYAKLKNYERALADYKEVIRINPRYAEAYRDRGWIYLTQGKYDQSARDYEESIRLDSEDASAFYYLASAYALQKSLKDTLSALRHCLETDQRRYWFSRIPEDPNFDFVRNDPRFHALLIEFSEAS